MTFNVLILAQGGTRPPSHWACAVLVDQPGRFVAVLSAGDAGTLVERSVQLSTMSHGREVIVEHCDVLRGPIFETGALVGPTVSKSGAAPPCDFIEDEERRALVREFARVATSVRIWDELVRLKIGPEPQGVGPLHDAWCDLLCDLSSAFAPLCKARLTEIAITLVNTGLRYMSAVEALLQGQIPASLLNPVWPGVARAAPGISAGL